MKPAWPTAVPGTEEGRGRGVLVGCHAVEFEHTFEHWECACTVCACVMAARPVAAFLTSVLRRTGARWRTGAIPTDRGAPAGSRWSAATAGPICCGRWTGCRPL